MTRFALLSLALTSLVPAQSTLFAPVLAEVKKIRAESGLRNASLGFAIIPLNAPDAKSLAGYQADLSLIPASTAKAITTATALELLGPAFQFETTLQHTGTISPEGALKGDLIIRGGGDPTLGASQIAATFAKWRTAVSKAGIKNIEGRVIGDATLFGTQMRADGWQWNDLGNYYAAGACGLTFHQNQFFCRFQTGQAGTSARFLDTDPLLPELTFENEMRVGAPGSGDNGYVYGAPYNDHLVLRGTVPAGNKTFTIRGALPDPAHFCADRFAKHLVQNNIAVAGDSSTLRLLRLAGGPGVSGTRSTIFEQKSEPLAKLIINTNHRSDNLYAECIHRIVGTRKGGNGSMAAASQAIAAHWNARGIDPVGFHMTDGCGLARNNAVTARQLALILYHTAKSPHYPTFAKSLPVAGKTGTMRFIGRGSASEGRVRAKSGSMERVKSYCGYIHAKSGKRYAFAILFNNFTCSQSALKPKIVRVWNKIVAL